jgi:hypothetical protein
MDAATVFRVISLIPDRMPRTQTGCVFNAGGQPDRVVLLSKFLSWLGPLDPISKEEQQLLGVRSGGGRPFVAGEEAGDETELDDVEPLDVPDEVEETPPLVAAGEADEEAELDDVDPLDVLDELEETPVKLPGAGTQIAA